MCSCACIWEFTCHSIDVAIRGQLPGARSPLVYLRLCLNSVCRITGRAVDISFCGIVLDARSTSETAKHQGPVPTASPLLLAKFDLSVV